MYSDFRIERLSENNLSDMGRLYHAVYGQHRQLPDFPKKYATAWTGVSCIGYFAYDQQAQPIAYYGVIPCLIRYGDTLVLSAQSGDTMTHPSHRGKGLFVLLCNMTIQLCQREGIRLLFGFPNQNSYPGFTGKLGWTVTEQLDCFAIPVFTLPLAGLSKRLPFLSGLYAKYAAALLKNTLAPQQNIASSALGNDTGGLHRNLAWFQYKTYSYSPVLQLGKAKAWIKLTDTFVIGDIEPGGQDFHETIRRLKQLAARLGYRRLFFHSSPGTALHQLFARSYKPMASFPVIVKDLGANIPIHRLKFTSSDIDTF